MLVAKREGFPFNHKHTMHTALTTNPTKSEIERATEKHGKRKVYAALNELERIRQMARIIVRNCGDNNFAILSQKPMLDDLSKQYDQTFNTYFGA